MATISPTASALSPVMSPSSLPSSSTTPMNAHHFLSIKLPTTNYLLWRTQIQHFLCSQGHFGYVDSSIPRPDAKIMQGSTAIDNPDCALWTGKDQYLMSVPISSLSEETLPLVVGLKTSREIWIVLETSLASASQTRIPQLHMQLQNLSQGDMPVTQFLYKAKGFSDELTAAGRPVSVQDFNSYIFKGLNPSFRDLVTAITTRLEPVCKTSPI